MIAKQIQWAFAFLAAIGALVVVLYAQTGPMGTSGNPTRIDPTGTTTQPVSGTFWQATQPVSGTFWQATQPVSGTFWQATQPVSGTFWQATQPISAASLPLPTGAALDATLTGRLPAGASPADAESNTNTSLSRIGAFLFGFNGSTWDRLIADASKYLVTSPAATALAGAAATDCNVLSAASTNSTSCKGSAGNLYGYELYNTTTTVYYLRLYNSSSAPTCSSATGFIRSIPIPPAASAGLVGGAVNPTSLAVNYATGIGYCLTGGSSSTDNTNAAVGIFGVLKYK